jgi:hypothetical protein
MFDPSAAEVERLHDQWITSSQRKRLHAHCTATVPVREASAGCRDKQAVQCAGTLVHEASAVC